MGIFDAIGNMFGGGMPQGPAAPAAQQQGDGMLDGLSSPLGQIGMQLIANHGTLQSQGGAFQGVPEALGRAKAYQEVREAKAERNKTKEFLRQNHPEIASMVDAGLDVGDAFNYAMRERQFAAQEARANRGPGPTDDMREFQFAQQNPEFAKYLQRGSTDGRLSTQPIYGTDADGNTVLGQLSNDGRFVPSNLPDGVRPMSPGQLNEQKASGTARGKNTAESQARLGAARATGQQVMAQVSALKTDPALGNVLGGFDSRTPIFREDSARAQARIDQIQGGAFLQARELLKGGGQITDYEGRKAEAAFIRMNQNQSPEDFKAALDEFNDAVQSGIARLEAAGGGGGGVPSGGGDYRDTYGLE